MKAIFSANQWNKLQLRLKSSASNKTAIITALGIAALLLCFMQYKTIVTNNLQMDISSQRLDYRRAIIASEELASAIKDMQAGQRGFLLTGNSEYLRPYRAAIANFNGLFDELSEADQLLPGVDLNIERIRALVSQKIEVLAQTIELKEQGDFEEALRIVQAATTKGTMQEIHSELERFDRAAFKRLAELNAQSNSIGSQAKRAVLGVSVLSVCLIIISLGLLVSTERKRRKSDQVLRISEDRFKALFDAMYQYIGLLDAQGVLLDANASALEAIAQTKSEVVGQPFWQTAWWRDLPEQQDFLKEAVHVAAKGELVKHECPVRTSNGIITVDFSLKPQLDDRGNLAFLIFEARDISERKQAELELEQRAQALHRSNQDLEQFAYVASHDLQEPLRAVASYTTMLERRYSHLLDERGKTFIHFAVDGASRMQALINDLLEYSRVGRSAVGDEEVDIGAVAHEVANDLAAGLKDAGGSIEIQSSLPTVRAVPHQLRQLLQNLIANAIKFRSPDRPLMIRVSHHGDQNREIVTVSDNGIGIADRHREKIFRLFERLHSRSEYPGTGLGLAICRKIVERHGGSLWVESQEGVGSSFHFSLTKGDANGKTS